MDYIYKSLDGKIGQGWNALEAMEAAYGKEALENMAISNGSYRPIGTSFVSEVQEKKPDEAWRKIGVVYTINRACFGLRAFAI